MIGRNVDMGEKLALQGVKIKRKKMIVQEDEDFDDAVCQL